MRYRFSHARDDVRPREQPAEPGCPQSGDHKKQGSRSSYLGPFVYGGIDGVVTTFAIVSGVQGAALGASVILILGLANLFADGLSMALGAFLSSRSQNEYYERELGLEQRQVECAPQAEQSELAGILRSRGYEPGEAEVLTQLESRDRDRLVEAMMVREVGLLREERRPEAIGLVTLGAFILAGAVPLLVYLAGLVVPISSQAAFPVAVALTGVALFALGAARVLVTERNWLRSGLEMLLVGGLAAGVAYLIGYLLQGLAP